MKKVICLILVCLILAGAFISCASGEASPASSPANGGERIAAEVSLVSSDGAGDARFGVKNYGHTFLLIRNTGDAVLDFCGRQLAPGEWMTLSWWAIDRHPGVWFNIETCYISALGRYSSRAAVTAQATDDEIKALECYVTGHDSYTPLTNCAYRAASAFDLTADPDDRICPSLFPMCTPAGILKKIRAAGGGSDTYPYVSLPISTGLSGNIQYYELEE